MPAGPPGDLPAAVEAWQQALQVLDDLGGPTSWKFTPGSSRPAQSAGLTRQASTTLVSQADAAGRWPSRWQSSRVGARSQAWQAPARRWLPAGFVNHRARPSLCGEWRARDLPRYRRHTGGTPGAGMVRSLGPASRHQLREAAWPERKETTMTTKQPAGTAAAPSAATVTAGTPRRRLTILASVLLVVLAGVVLAVTGKRAIKQEPRPAPGRADGGSPWSRSRW